MKVVVIIPARYASVRFPGKVLAPIAGKPMIQRVWERARVCDSISEVYVATDDERVERAVTGFGGRVIMTSSDHRSGSERVSEAVEKISADVVINLQGDEPLMSPDSLELVTKPFREDENVAMASLKFPLLSYQDYMSPNVVKVVCDNQDNAIYFSRSPIPYYREGQALLKKWEAAGALPAGLLPPPLKHIGVYAYRVPFLGALVRMPRSPLEDAETLEQLRALAWGFRIKVVTTPHDSIGVDTPQDLARVEEIIKSVENR